MSWIHPVKREKKNTSPRDRRYKKMLLLILDYLIWLMTAGSFILWERIVTFMAGRRPSKGLRAWQKHRDGDCKWSQDNVGVDWVWDLWELVKPCGASGGLGFCPDTFTKATQTYTHIHTDVCVCVCLCSFHGVVFAYKQITYRDTEKQTYPFDMHDTHACTRTY